MMAMEESTEQAGTGRRRRVHEDQARVLQEFERRLVAAGQVPDADQLVSRRYSVVLHVLIAVAIGSIVALASIIVNYVVFTKLLHLR